MFCSVFTPDLLIQPTNLYISFLFPSVFFLPYPPFDHRLSSCCLWSRNSSKGTKENNLNPFPADLAFIIVIKINIYEVMMSCNTLDIYCDQKEVSRLNLRLAPRGVPSPLRPIIFERKAFKVFSSNWYDLNALLPCRDGEVWKGMRQTEEHIMKQNKKTKNRNRNRKKGSSFCALHDSALRKKNKGAEIHCSGSTDVGTLCNI